MSQPHVSVLVPYRPDRGHRTTSWRWLARRWAALLPSVEVIVADDGGGRRQDPGDFNHPKAINLAASRAARDVFVIADADTVFDPDWIVHAADLVLSGAASWVMPRFYVKLNRRASERVLRDHPSRPIRWPDEDCEWVGENVAWSGMVVVPRGAFATVTGYDERFAKWGSDDTSFGLSVDTLWGPHTRLEGACWHLWHPQPLTQTYGHDRHQEQYELAERYKAAAGDEAAMREVRWGDGSTQTEG